MGRYSVELKTSISKSIFNGKIKYKLEQEKQAFTSII